MIPDEVREKVIGLVDKFNQKELQGVDCHYIARFQGRFLYLDRIAYGKKEPVSRMEYLRAHFVRPRLGTLIIKIVFVYFFLLIKNFPENIYICHRIHYYTPKNNYIFFRLVSYT